MKQLVPQVWHNLLFQKNDGMLEQLFQNNNKLIKAVRLKLLLSA